MKQPHDEIIKNWTARAAKLKAAYMDSEKPYGYSQAAQSFVPGGISYGHYTGEQEQITIRSQWQNVDGGEYVIKKNHYARR